MNWLDSYCAEWNTEPWVTWTSEQHQELGQVWLCSLSVPGVPFTARGVQKSKIDARGYAAYKFYEYVSSEKSASFFITTHI